MKRPCNRLEGMIIEIEVNTDVFGDRFIYFCKNLYSNGIAIRPFICKGNKCEYLSRLYIDSLVLEDEYKKHDN